MYCPACGVAVAQGLSYCNYCGAKLNVEKGDGVVKSAEAKTELLVSAMVVVFVLGLGAITGLMAVMKAVLDLNTGQILAFTLLSFLVMLLVEGVIIRLLFRRNRGAEKPGDTALSKEQATKELDAAQTRALPEPIRSVTEHTTRAFEPIYSEQKSK
jgi:predicted amidophosphoribosyltransferase